MVTVGIFLWCVKLGIIISFYWNTDLIFQVCFIHSDVHTKRHQVQPNHSEFPLIKYNKVAIAEGWILEAVRSDLSIGTTSVINTVKFEHVLTWFSLNYVDVAKMKDVQWSWGGEVSEGCFFLLSDRPLNPRMDKYKICLSKGFMRKRLKHQQFDIFFLISTKENFRKT